MIGTSSATEAVEGRYAELDAWHPAEALNALWEAQLAAAACVGASLPSIREAALAAAGLLGDGGRLVYAGAGTSGRIAAQDGAELAPTFGWPHERVVLLLAGGSSALTQAAEGAEDDEAAAARAAEANELDCMDVVVGVAASGATPFTCGCLDAARARGCLTIGVANNAGSRLLAIAAHPILLATGAEPLAGSTRLKAGTAQKIALNLFSTLLMLQLGRVHRGLMVDMRPSNAKLRRRALDMVQRLTGADAPAARHALDRGDGDVKCAVLLLRGLTVDAAREALRRHGGVLRAALAELDG